jgi:hypothetical protein
MRTGRAADDAQMSDPLSTRRRSMLETLTPFLIFAGALGAWFALNRWVLPRFGVKT